MTRLIAVLAALFAASPALAHLSPEEHGSFMAGLSHPVFGLDHILAMIAVGLWAALLAGRAMWTLPTGFVGAMVVGYLAAVAGMPLPFVEPMILISVLVLGLAVALAVRLPQASAVALVAAFGLFHGHAHGGELGSAGALAFGVGFAVSTAILHVLGLTVALAARQAVVGSRVIRGLGWATAAGGLWIALAG